MNFYVQMMNGVAVNENLMKRIAYFKTKKMYSGTIYDFYDFSQFPFDKQILRIGLPDAEENHFLHLNLNQSS